MFKNHVLKAVTLGSIITSLFLTSCNRKNDHHSLCHAPLDLTAHTTITNAERPRDYLSTTYANLLIEIDYDSEQPPDGNVLLTYKQKLLERIQQKNISFTLNKIPRINCNNSLTIDTLVTAETVYRDQKTGAGTLTLYVLWLEETFNNYAGINYSPSSIALLDIRHDNSQQLSILMHETGHILGLVGFRTPVTSQHQTTDKLHCSTKGCVMEPIINKNNVSYCTPCINDLQAADGR